jgi:hypothetical protein
MRSITKRSKEKMTMSPETIDVAAVSARRALRILVSVLAMGLVGAVFAAPSMAKQDISEFVISSSNPQAGAHPDLVARLKLEGAGEPEVAKEITANFPTGIFGNPGAIFKCRAADFVINQCQPGSQAGVVTIVANYEGNPNFILGTAPVYNMEVLTEDEVGRLAFVAPTIKVPISVPLTVRSESDYGVRMSITSVSQSVALASATLQVWGFPASPEHDSSRFPLGSPGSPSACPGLTTTLCIGAPYPKAGIQPRPFIDSPSRCTGEPLPVTIDVTTYQDPVPSHGQGVYPPVTGCEAQKFDPVFRIGLTTGETDAPSGLDLQLRAEQFLEGEAPAQSTLRSSTVTLPPGLTINPDAADGQSACPEALAHFGSTLPGACPDSSKIGTVDVHTPALEGPLVGSLYIGEPEPGNQYRVFMIFDGFGVHAKLAADIHPDPVTGQLTAVFEELPQVPFEEFNLHLFASDRGLMATPTRCTVYSATARLVPWNDALSPQNSTDVVGLTAGPNGTGCPGEVRPFRPRLVAGTSTPTAGEFSAFTLKLDRDDGDQFLGDLNFKMPPGFTGSLRGISYCGEGAIAAAPQNLGRTEQVAPSCPASSQIGTTNVAAGPGNHPFHAVGKMYLAGPFKGAPLSVVAITPALAGPYDYGVVVVRVALHVDPLTAQVKAVSDTVPAIIGGIPIRMRSIQVNLDKPKFTINPTNCSPFTVDSQGIGDQGTVTDFSSYFQVVNCAALPFKPKMTIRQLGGKKASRRAANPGLQLDLKTRNGEANIKSVSVTLSHAFEIDQRHLGNICSEKELAEKQCAGRTPIGRASTKTPLLDQPLRGPVYAVSGSGGLPRLAFILNGQVNLVPRAETTTVGGRLKTTAPVIPDAPIGHFSLTVFGGKSGYLINTRNICNHRPVIAVGYVGQNGKTTSQKIEVKTRCGKKQKRAKRHHP